MTEHNKVSHNVVTDALKADINARAAKAQNLADLASATIARSNLGFPATASRYLRNDVSGAPAALSASDSVNLDAYAAGDIMLAAGADGAALAAALATGKNVRVPASVTSISLSALQAQTVLPLLYRVALAQTTTLNVAAGQYTFSSGNAVRLGPGSAPLRLIGAAPIPLTMSSVASVTGSTGNWLVTYNVTAPGGVGVNTVVAVGDAVKNFEIAPLAELSGDNSAGYVLRNRPIANELYNPVVNIGGVTISAAGSSATFAGGGVSTTTVCLAANDLLTINGQTRPISSVALGSCNITGTWGTIGASQELSYFVSLPNTGTITISGTAVTGTSTLFLSEANVGDMLLVDGELIEITAITNDTSMTLQKAKTLGVGTAFSILTAGELHNGIHEVTAVTSSTITLRNRSRSKPPINKVTGGSMNALTTVFKMTATGAFGIYFEQASSIAWLDQIAVRGPGASGGFSVGLAMNGKVDALPLAIDGSTSFGNVTQHGYVTSALTGPNFGIFDFYVNYFLGHGCTLDARMSAGSGAVLINVWQMEGAEGNYRRFVNSGSGRLGLAINGAAGGALITEMHCVGNVDDGLRVEAGSSVYGEGPIFWGNGAMNVRLNGGELKVSQAFFAMAAASNLYIDKGKAVVNECLFGAPRTHQIDAQSAVYYSADNSWLTGAGNSNGINNVNSKGHSNNAAIVGNKNIGVYVDNAGEHYGSALFTKGNAAATVRVDDGGRLWIPGASIADATVSGTGCMIDITGIVSPSPTLSGVARRNEMTKDGSVIRDGAASTGFGTAGLRVNGGANLSFLGFATSVTDVGSIPAGEQVTFDITVTGATATGMGATANSNGVPAGVQLAAHIPTTNTVRLSLDNNTAGAIDPSNATYSTIVIGASA